MKAKVKMILTERIDVYLTTSSLSYSFCIHIKGASNKHTNNSEKAIKAREELQFIIIYCTSCHVWHAV